METRPHLETFRKTFLARYPFFLRVASAEALYDAIHRMAARSGDKIIWDDRGMHVISSLDNREMREAGLCNLLPLYL